MFAAADGGETERRVVEFGPQADWGEQTFIPTLPRVALSAVSGV